MKEKNKVRQNDTSQKVVSVLFGNFGTFITASAIILTILQYLFNLGRSIVFNIPVGSFEINLQSYASFAFLIAPLAIIYYCNMEIRGSGCLARLFTDVYWSVLFSLIFFLFFEFDFLKILFYGIVFGLCVWMFHYMFAFIKRIAEMSHWRKFRQVHIFGKSHGMIDLSIYVLMLVLISFLLGIVTPTIPVNHYGCNIDGVDYAVINSSDNYVLLQKATVEGNKLKIDTSAFICKEKDCLEIFDLGRNAVYTDYYDSNGFIRFMTQE